MVRVSRSRSRMYTHVGRSLHYTDAIGVSSPAIVSLTRNVSSSCSDMRGSPVVPSPFESNQATGMLTVSGQANSAYNTFLTKWENAPYWNGMQSEVNDPTPLPAPSGWELSAVARSNPSRPALYPAELIQSIVQLPSQLRGLLRLLQDPRTLFTPKGASNNYLSLVFGWLPMIDDFKKIANWQQLILKKNKQLSQLYSGKGLRRKIPFTKSSTKTTTAYERFALSGPNNYIDARCSVTVTKRTWATVRWKPTQPPPYRPGDAGYANYLKRIVFGLTPEGLATGAWKIIPWTWLIGWFTNIGDYLMVNSNTVPAAYSNVCFMSESVFKLQPSGYTAVGCYNVSVVVGGSYRRTRKTRIVSGALTPGFNMPYLDMFRQSVLGALAIQRIRW